MQRPRLRPPRKPNHIPLLPVTQNDRPPNPLRIEHHRHRPRLRRPFANVLPRNFHPAKCRRTVPRNINLRFFPPPQFAQHMKPARRIAPCRLILINRDPPSRTGNQLLNERRCRRQRMLMQLRHQNLPTQGRGQLRKFAKCRRTPLPRQRPHRLGFVSMRPNLLQEPRLKIFSATRPKRRQNHKPNSIPVRVQFPVRRIFAPRKFSRLRVFPQRCLREIQQWPNQFHCAIRRRRRHRRHPRQARSLNSAHRPHHKKLNLVIRMMRQRHRPSRLPRRRCQKLVPQLPRRHLNRDSVRLRMRTDIRRTTLKQNLQPRRLFPDKRLIPIRFRPAKLVIKMRDHQLSPRPHQQIQQHHRIHPARNCHGQRRLARRQSVNLFSKPGKKVHSLRRFAHANIFGKGFRRRPALNTVSRDGTSGSI